MTLVFDSAVIRKVNNGILQKIIIDIYHGYPHRSELLPLSHVKVSTKASYWR